MFQYNREITNREWANPYMQGCCTEREIERVPGGFDHRGVSGPLGVQVERLLLLTGDLVVVLFPSSAESSQTMASVDWFQCRRRAVSPQLQVDLNRIIDISPPHAIANAWLCGFGHDTTYMAIVYFNRFSSAPGWSPPCHAPPLNCCQPWPPCSGSPD
jgi:hypothetical protein